MPKGSFYHYFDSKDAFGEALLSSYFEDYLADLDKVMSQPGLTMAQRLLNYFDMWRANQSFLDCQGKCLAVKLAAEVADLSEAMRAVLNQGTSAIIARLNAEVLKAVGDPEVRRKLEDLGFAVRGSSAEELRVMTRDQLAKYARVIKEMGIANE